MTDDVKLPERVSKAIEALERAVEAHELEKRPEFAVQTEFHLNEARDELRAEIAAALEADAARLDFVEREGLLCGAWYSADADGEGFLDGYFCEKPETGDEALGPTLRDAIDSARQIVEVE